MLLALNWSRLKDPSLSLGQASILANLRQNNIQTTANSWAVNGPNFSPSIVSDFILQHANIDTDVALGAFVWNEKATQAIIRKLKASKFPGRIILGGPQISYVKKDIEHYYPEADIFIRGYAEHVLVQLMQAKELTPTIKGIHYAGKPDLGLSAMADLETLPSPFLTGLISPQRFIRWETQRGCPFRCSFCQHRESDITMKRRQFSLERILEEAKWISQNKIIQDVAVLDPIFNSGPNYLTILDQLIEGKFTGKLALQCRIEMLKPAFLDRIVKLNETGRVVLEFGLQTIHLEEQKIIDRISNIKLIEKMLLEVTKRNIEAEISLIFGLPKQTVKSFRESIEFCKRYPFKVLAFPLMLLRGTELYYKKNELGLVESTEIASPSTARIRIGISHVVTSPSFTYDDWKEMANIAALLENTEHPTKNIKSEKDIVSALAITSEKTTSLASPISFWNQNKNSTAPENREKFNLPYQHNR